MNQFGFHDGLRLGVPGIVLTFLVYLWLRRWLGLNIGLAELAVLGVFVGLIFAPVLASAHTRYFDALTATTRTDQQIAAAIRLKLDATKAEHRYLTDAQLYAAALAYYASRYNEGELYAFRASKTYGIMYYNLFLTLVIGLAPSVALLLDGTPAGWTRGLCLQIVCLSARRCGTGRPRAASRTRSSTRPFSGEGSPRHLSPTSSSTRTGRMGRTKARGDRASDADRSCPR